MHYISGNRQGRITLTINRSTVTPNAAINAFNCNLPALLRSNSISDASLIGSVPPGIARAPRAASSIHVDSRASSKARIPNHVGRKTTTRNGNGLDVTVTSAMKPREKIDKRIPKNKRRRLPSSPILCSSSSSDTGTKSPIKSITILCVNLTGQWYYRYPVRFTTGCSESNLLRQRLFLPGIPGGARVHTDRKRAILQMVDPLLIEGH